MTHSVLPPVRPADPPIDQQIADLARKYRDARGLGLQILGVLGKSASSLLDQLPRSVRDGLDAGTQRALEVSFDAASRSRGPLPDAGTWLTRAITIGTGAAGGFGGTPTALAELPVTTTVILRAIQGIAAEHGFDPAHEDTRLDCLQVLAAAGPLSEDDQTDIAFLTMRLSVTGATLQGLIKQIAPRLAVVLGQKLAAQTVPVLGAVTGAAINYSFTSYYQEVAHVQFALRKLAEDTGTDRAQLIEQFRVALKN